MCLLDIPSWIQAVTAIAALAVAMGTGVIGWLTYKSQKGIKTLTDVVIEMKNQTKVLNNSYLLQERLALFRLIPYFSGFEFKQNAVNSGKTLIESYSLVLINRGTSAKNVHLFLLTKDDYTLYQTSDKNIYHDETLHFNVTPNERYLAVNKFDFKIILFFHDDLGNEFKQLVAIKDSVIRVLPPELNIEREKSFDADTLDFAGML